jgi:hypothetical protein
MMNNVSKLLTGSELVEEWLGKIFRDNSEGQFSFKVIISDVGLIVSNES